MRFPVARLSLESRLACALIVVAVIAAFGNVVFFGKSLVVSDNSNPLDFRYLPQNYGPGFVPPEAWSRRNLVAFPNYRDPAMANLQTEPAAELLRRSLARGEFPFWDPYTGGGTPVFAALVPAYLFPPSLIVVILGNTSLVRNAYILALIAASGILTYFLLRARGLLWQSSLAGGIAFAFSGAMIQTAVTGLGQPVAFFSLPLLATARLLDEPCARRAAQFAAAAAFVALATFPPILMQIFGTCILYALAATVLRARGARAAAAGWFCGGSVSAIALVAVAYVPAFFVMAGAPHIAQHYAQAAESVVPPISALQLLSPAMFGGAAVYADSPLALPEGDYLYYTGVVALFLAFVGTLARAAVPARALKIAVVAAGALAAAKVFGLPVVQWIAHVPVLRTIHYGAYFGILIAYTIAVLTAFGVDAIASGRAARWHLELGALAAGTLLALVRVYAAQQGVESHAEGWRWIADFRLVVLFAALAVALAFSAALSTRRARMLALGAIVAVLAAEGITNASYPRQRRWNVWRHPPQYVAAITARATGGRVQPLPAFPANTTSAFGQPTLDSMTLFSSPRIFELYRRYFFPRISHFLIQTTSLPPERVLDAANVEYLPVMSMQNALLAETRRRGYDTIYRDELVNLMRRPTAPRYFFTSDYEVKSAAAALEALPTLRSGAVVVEHQPSFQASPEPPIAPRVVRFALNDVELTIDAPRAGLLYCSESQMSGWVAAVDGREAPIVPANYAFRAVEVPAGRHAVRLHYRPPGLLLGLFFSAAGLMALVVGLRRPAPRSGRES